MFGDDTKISCRITYKKDCDLLQKDLDYLMNWKKDWHLDFNTEKCKTMRIGHKLHTDHKLNGVKLQEVEEEKDMGITVVNNLKPFKSVCKSSSKSYASTRCDKKEFCLK